MSVIRVDKVKTRKEHVCWGCARKMPKGTLMTVVVAVEGSKPNMSYWCAVCTEYGDKYFDEDEPVTLGAFRDYDGDKWEEIRKQIEGVIA